jgi:hypothetical protein
MAPSWAYGWRRRARMDGAVVGVSMRTSGLTCGEEGESAVVGTCMQGRGRVGAHRELLVRADAAKGRHIPEYGGKHKVVFDRVQVVRFAVHVVRHTLLYRLPQYPHGSSPRDGPRRGGRLHAGCHGTRTARRSSSAASRGSQPRPRPCAAVSLRRRPASLRHERDKARARKGAIHHSAKGPPPTDSAPAGSTASRPLVVIFTFTAAGGGLHSRWWWSSRYASASALGGSKHRQAHASASEHVLHGEHVRGAGQRQHIRQAARGREVEGVTSAGLQCGTA